MEMSEFEFESLLEPVPEKVPGVPESEKNQTNVRLLRSVGIRLLLEDGKPLPLRLRERVLRRRTPTLVFSSDDSDFLKGVLQNSVYSSDDQRAKVVLRGKKTEGGTIQGLQMTYFSLERPEKPQFSISFADGASTPDNTFVHTGSKSQTYDEFVSHSEIRIDMLPLLSYAQKIDRALDMQAQARGQSLHARSANDSGQ